MAAAAWLMCRRRVKRLPVVDGTGRLAGIVSRLDVLGVVTRPGEQIRAEITAKVNAGSRAPPGRLRGDRDRRHRHDHRAGKTPAIATELIDAAGASKASSASAPGPTTPPERHRGFRSLPAVGRGLTAGRKRLPSCRATGR